jgi:NitT/TauT family transport system substrate-binding protein
MAEKHPGRGLLAGVMLLMTCGVASTLSAETAKPLQRVSVRLNFLPGVEHAFLYLGKQKGWYAEQGIDLEVIPGQVRPSQ